jgi:hypothetical protein
MVERPDSSSPGHASAAPSVDTPSTAEPVLAAPVSSARPSLPELSAAVADIRVALTSDLRRAGALARHA